MEINILILIIKRLCDSHVYGCDMTVETAALAEYFIAKSAWMCPLTLVHSSGVEFEVAGATKTFPTNSTSVLPLS